MKVSELKKIDFKSLTLEEKSEIMKIGRPTPHIRFDDNDDQKKGALISKKLDTIMFRKFGWLCSCDETNALYCFTCLLFGGDDDWTKEGIHSIKQLPIKIKKHENSAKHKNNSINLVLNGKEKISPNINNRHEEFVRIHNERVKKNLDSLSKIINVVKLCGFCDLSLTGDKDKDNKLTNYDMFTEILDYTKNIDVVLNGYFLNNEIPKNTSHMVQCELLACMVNVCRLHIYSQIKESSFLTCMVEDVSDIATQKGIETALILRYEFQGKIYERFWGFLKRQYYEDEGLSGCLLKAIKPLVEESPDKFIAQTYDGMTDFKISSEDLRKKIKETYTSAHHVHSYTHNLSKIVEQLSYQVSSACIFFANVKKISNFFNKFPERIGKLQKISDEMPKESQKKLNFESDPIRTILENREILIKCFENFQSGKYKPSNIKSMQEAANLSKWLKDTTFLFWLTFFETLMQYVNNLDKKLHTSPVDVTKIDEAVKNFQQTITTFRDIFQIKSSEVVENELGVKESELKNYSFQEDEYILMKKISDFKIKESSSDSDFESITLIKQNSELELIETNSCCGFESISQDQIKEGTGSEFNYPTSLQNSNSIISSENYKSSARVTASNSQDNLTEISISDNSKEVLGQTETGQEEFNFKYDHLPYDCSLNDAARLMCDIILAEIKERFKFKQHLYGPNLFINGRYERYSRKLPTDIINKFCEAFPMIEKNVLKTELDIFYKRSELHKLLKNTVGCLKTLNFISACGLQTVFKEITKALKIIVTLPIITRESSRCLSTVDNVKRYLKTHKDQNELKVTALAILQIEKAMVKDIPDFNDKVIDIYIQEKEKRKAFHLIAG